MFAITLNTAAIQPTPRVLGKIEDLLMVKWIPEDFDLSVTEGYIRPFHTFLIKVATLCNLDCTYCYVYNMPDKSWKGKPKFLEPDVAEQVAFRIQEHVLNNDLQDVTIIFHGGEPLLAGVDRLERLVSIFNVKISCEIHWGIQSNATLIDEGVVAFFEKYKFKVGVSLDGSKAINDRHRLTHSGHSSYDDTVNGIRLIQKSSKWQEIFGGILMVIDLENDPRDMLETARSIGIKSVNPILPDAHHDYLPPKVSSSGEGKYGDWLCELFLLWFTQYQDLSIPYFDQIIELMLGGVSKSEEIGAESVDLVVVETNGTLEAVDTLKVVGKEATHLGMDVFSNSFDEAFSHPAIYSRMAGFNTLAKNCLDCKYLKNCGGGYVPHRYSNENGFINPSVYCNDLMSLFALIQERIFR